MRKFITLLILLINTFCAHSQLADLARIEYTVIPSGDSTIQFSRKRALLNYPIKLKNEAFLLVGLDYSAIDLSFDKEIDKFDKNQIKDFQILDLNLAYTFKINDDWRFAIRLSSGFSSNLTTRSLLFEDMTISSDAVFIKNKKGDGTAKKPNRLIVGMSYSGNRGLPFPIPFISYYRKFHPKWSYNVGVPISNLQYHWSEKFRAKLFAQLDGFNSNLQNRLSINETNDARGIRMSLILGGTRFEYKLTNHIESFFNTTYILSNVVQLRDGRETLFTIQGLNTFHFRMGIRFKI